MLGWIGVEESSSGVLKHGNSVRRLEMIESSVVANRRWKEVGEVADDLRRVSRFLGVASEDV